MKSVSLGYRLTATCLVCREEKELRTTALEMIWKTWDAFIACPPCTATLEKKKLTPMAHLNAMMAAHRGKQSIRA